MLGSCFVSLPFLQARLSFLLLHLACVSRLLSRLDMYGLCEVAVHGDGNCQVGVTRHFVSVPCSRCLYCMQK